MHATFHFTSPPSLILKRWWWQKYKIIGCTTVGAAKLRNVLREVGPTVVLVEEAGEIFEAQVIRRRSRPLACDRNAFFHWRLLNSDREESQPMCRRC